MEELNWVYVDSSGAEHGWFSDADRAEMDSVTRGGYSWRHTSTYERESFKRYVGQLAYEQS